MEDDSGRKMRLATPKRRESTPPRALFADYPAAYSSINNQQIDESKIAFTQPGMEPRENPFVSFARSQIDATRESYDPSSHGHASVRARALSGTENTEIQASDFVRPITPLLPPLPDMTMPTRVPLTGSTGKKSRGETTLEYDLGAGIFGPDDMELKLLKPVTSMELGTRQKPVIRNSQSFFNLKGSPTTSDRNVNQQLPNFHGARGRIEKSGTVGESFKSRRAIVIRSSAEIFGVDDKDMELYQQSSASKVPASISKIQSDDNDWPLIGCGRRPDNSPGGELAAPVSHDDEQRVESFIGARRDRNARHRFAEDHDARVPDISTPTRGGGRNRNIPHGRLPWFGPNGEMAIRDLSGREINQLRSAETDHEETGVTKALKSNAKSDYDDDSLRGAEQHISSSDAEKSGDEYFLQPKTYQPPPRRGRPGKAPVVRTPFGNVDPRQWGPQSSSSQSLGADLSFLGEASTRAGLFQNEDTLASLTGESVSFESTEEVTDSRRDEKPRLTLSEGPVKTNAEDEDADWNATHESDMKSKSTTRKFIAHDESQSGSSESSLANLLSQGSLKKADSVAVQASSLSRGDNSLIYPGNAVVRHPFRSGHKIGQKEVLTKYQKPGVDQRLQQKPSTTNLPSFASAPNPRFVPQRSKLPTYEHPSPLQDGHIHPFTSSPPLIKESGENLPPLTSLDKDSEEVRENPYDYRTELDRSGVKHLVSLRCEESSTGSEIVSACLASESSSSNPAVSSPSILSTSTQQFLPHSGGSFSKTTVLGARENFTGTPNGTGMRAIDSSEADICTDPAVMERPLYHAVESVDAGDIESSSAVATSNTIASENATMKASATSAATASAGETIAKVSNTKKSNKKKGTKKKQAEPDSAPSLSTPVPVVTTSAGIPVSTPNGFEVPLTLPDSNSFTQRAVRPLIYGECTDEMVIERIAAANDDMQRIGHGCPIFPLRDDFLDSKMTLLGKPVDSPRATRGETRESDGRFFESCYCYKHMRWEFSHAPTLRRQYRGDKALLQHKAGQELVSLSLKTIPVLCVGLLCLYKIAYGEPESGELIQWWTNGEIAEVHEDEQKLAKDWLFAVVFFGLMLFFCLLAMTVTIVINE